MTGSWAEHDKGLVSTDPLKFSDTKPYKGTPESLDRQHGAEGRDHRGLGTDRRHRDGGGRHGVRLHRRQHGRGGRREDRPRDRACPGGAPSPRHCLLLGRRADDGRGALADADGKGVRRAGAARPRAAAVHLGVDRSDHGRRDRELRDAGRPEHRGAEGADRLRRSACDRADDPTEAARGLPAQRIPARERHDRSGDRSPRDEGGRGQRAPLHGRATSGRLGGGDEHARDGISPRPADPSPQVASARPPRSTCSGSNSSGSNSGSRTSGRWSARWAIRNARSSRCTSRAPTERAPSPRWSTRRSAPPDTTPPGSRRRIWSISPSDS